MHRGYLFYIGLLLANIATLGSTPNLSKNGIVDGFVGIFQPLHRLSADIATVACDAFDALVGDDDEDSTLTESLIAIPLESPLPEGAIATIPAQPKNPKKERLNFRYGVIQKYGSEEAALQAITKRIKDTFRIKSEYVNIVPTQNRELTQHQRKNIIRKYGSEEAATLAITVRIQNAWRKKHCIFPEDDK